jgi:hypothetical protein
MSVLRPRGERSFLASCASMAMAFTCSCPMKPAPCVESCDAGDLERDAGSVDTDAGRPDGGDAGERLGFDAGTPDDAGIFDWRIVRGDPFSLEVVAENVGQPRALFAHTHAMVSGCDAGRCVWRWYADAGGVLRERGGLAEHSEQGFSPDGRLHSVLALERRQRCTTPDGDFDQLVGTPLLVDLESGEDLVRGGLTTTIPTPDPTFTSGSRWWRFYDSPACQEVRTTVRATRAPFAMPPALAQRPEAFVEDELPSGDLIGDERGAYFVVSPDDAGSLMRFTTDVDSVQRSGSWFHGWEGSPVRAMRHFDGQFKRLRVTPVDFQTTDFLVGTAFGRYATLPAVTLAADGGGRRVDIVDGAGIFPTHTVQTRPLMGRLQLAIAVNEDFAVFGAPGSQTLARLDLRDGGVSPIDVDAGNLRVLGNGRFVTASNANDVHFIFRHRVELIENVVGLFGFEGNRPTALPQDDVVFVVTASPLSGNRSLLIVNAATLRRVRVTDSLFFNPPFNAPFFADAMCGSPGFARSIGPEVMSGLLPSQAIHFTEFVAAATPALRLFALPLNLSEPPRLLAELPPDQCAPPLLARDQSRWWVPIRGSEGVTRAVFARP